MKTGYKTICALVIAAAIVGLFAATANAIATTDDTITTQGENTQVDGGTASITVTGTGTIELEPSQAVVEIGILVDDSTATGAWQGVAEAANNVLEALRDIEIADQDMETANYSLQVRWDRYYEEIVGYTCSYTLKITVRDLDKVGNVIDTSVEAGANRVYSIEFTRDEAEIREAKRNSFRDAAEDARLQAETIASAFGARVIGVTGIQVNGQYWYPWIYRYSGGLAELAPSTPVLPGNIEATSSLTVTYEIGWS